jgi:arylsulfatase A-like enzyme
MITDDQGWADIGYNNPDKVYTPNLDRLAANGVTFARHYVMPQCTPTRVAAMTGRYPSRFGGAAMQASNEPAFPKGTPTLASMLRDAGYATHLSGKWHLGSTADHGPNHFGFESSYGSLAGAVGMYEHAYRKGKFAVTWHRDHEIIPGHEDGTHVTDLVTADAIRFVSERRDRPFFLYLAYHAPHTPLDERGRFTDQPTQLDPDNPKRWRNEDEIEWFNDPKGLIQSEPDPEKRLLLAAVHHLDHGIGCVVKALEESGQLDNTLLLFSSDNGPQVNWPGNAYPHDLRLTDFNQPHPFRGKKTHVWDGGIRVPGFAHWPAKIKPRKDATPVHIVDWFPTLASVTGAGIPNKLDGLDLSECLTAGQPLAEREILWSWSNPPNRWAITDGRWKLVRYGNTPPVEPSDWQLFDLLHDPEETTDLAAKHSERVRTLHQRYMGEARSDAGN